MPVLVSGLGSVRPCCDPNMNVFSQVFSDACDYCTDSSRAAQDAVMQLPINKGNTTGVPNCDPNASVLDDIFSNTCNVSAPDAISHTLGLPSQIPAYVYWGVAGLGALLLLKLRP